MQNRFPPLAAPAPAVLDRRPVANLPFRSLPMGEIILISLMVLILASA